MEAKITFLMGPGGSGKSFLAKLAIERGFLTIDLDREAEDPVNKKALTKYIYEVLTSRFKLKLELEYFLKIYKKSLEDNESKVDKAIDIVLREIEAGVVDTYNSVIVPAYKNLFTNIIIKKITEAKNEKKPLG